MKKIIVYKNIPHFQLSLPRSTCKSIWKLTSKRKVLKQKRKLVELEFSLADSYQSIGILQPLRLRICCPKITPYKKKISLFPQVKKTHSGNFTAMK